MAGIDYTTRYKDYARFAPAISEMFTVFVAGNDKKRPCPVNKADLDFLNPNSNFYHIPISLYSAGQAAKTAKSAQNKNMVTARTPGTSLVVGDSGGYQVLKDSIKFEGDITRERLLRWLEANCDWSMILDFPTGAIEAGIINKHTERLIAEGYENRLEQMGATNNRCIGFNTCLLQTLINNDYFVQHRKPDATKFLNVIQGRNIEESDIWYNAVKHYDFEGWSMAGNHVDNMEMLLRRLIMMRDDGFLQNRDWLHVLGVGKLMHGCAYTTIQRQIREQINPNFTISYDVSTPFTNAAHGAIMMGYSLEKSGWNIKATKVCGEHNVGNPTRFCDFLRADFDARNYNSNAVFVETAVGRATKISDLCVNTGKGANGTWDVCTYALMMHHNLQIQLEAVFDSQDLYDREDIGRIPTELLELKHLIPSVFASETPYDLIHSNRKLLMFMAKKTRSKGTKLEIEFDMPDILANKQILEKLDATRTQATRRDAAAEYQDQFKKMDHLLEYE